MLCVWGGGGGRGGGFPWGGPRGGDKRGGPRTERGGGGAGAERYRGGSWAWFSVGGSEWGLSKRIPRQRDGEMGPGRQALRRLEWDTDVIQRRPGKLATTRQVAEDSRGLWRESSFLEVRDGAAINGLR